MATRMVIDSSAEAEFHKLVSRVVGNVILDVAVDVERFVPVDSGDLQVSTDLHHDGDHGYVSTGNVGDGVNYWSYVEYGTRYMDAEPYMRPALYRKRHLRHT